MHPKAKFAHIENIEDEFNFLPSVIGGFINNLVLRSYTNSKTI